MNKILITGGCGYVGSKLVPFLLNKGYEISVIDLMIYGNSLPSHKNLNVYQDDIRNLHMIDDLTKSHDIFIHLACISNDPSFELDPGLGKSINFDCFEDIVKISKKNLIKRFILASSGAVYGINEHKNITEDIETNPITDYAVYKLESEKVLFKYTDDNFVGSAIRSATVCGYAPRQRLDVVVNILTNLAYNKKEISVFGGDQLRPNIHIDDVCEAYLKFIEADKNLINHNFFNICGENHKVSEIADIVKSCMPFEVKIKTTTSDDIRSYHLSSAKIKKVLNFQCSKNIKIAVNDLVKSFKDGLLPNSLTDENYFNVKKMKKINLT